jgi:hypothetical protein
MEFHKGTIGSYDEMNDIGIYTELFTKLDGIEIIDEKHPFIYFLRGFTHNEFECDIVHGWYHIETKSMKCIPKQHPSRVGNIIHTAWQAFWENNYYDYDVYIYVYIYYSYSGELYRSNEYEIDKKEFYRDFVKKMVEKI